MSQELHYTSVPRGLLPGTRGFCTVASTPNMAGPLRERLEGLSGYQQVFPPHDAKAALNPVVFSHHRLSLGGQLYSVLSRVACAELDYTSRSNKYAHHVVLDPGERPAGGPAWLLSQPGFMEPSWQGEPRFFTAGRIPPQGEQPGGIARAWQALTGDAGWAGALAESFLADPHRPAFLIFEPGMEILPLFAEALALLPAECRWDVDFSTYFTKLPQGLNCAWRGVLAGSPEAKRAASAPSALVLDLGGDTDAACGGSLVEFARTGKRPDPDQARSALGRERTSSRKASPAAANLELSSDLAGRKQDRGRAYDVIPGLESISGIADELQPGRRPSARSTRLRWVLFLGSIAAAAVACSLLYVYRGSASHGLIEQFSRRVAEKKAATGEEKPAPPVEAKSKKESVASHEEAPPAKSEKPVEKVPKKEALAAAKNAVAVTAPKPDPPRIPANQLPAAEFLALPRFDRSSLGGTKTLSKRFENLKGVGPLSFCFANQDLEVGRLGDRWVIRHPSKGGLDEPLEVAQFEVFPDAVNFEWREGPTDKLRLHELRQLLRDSVLKLESAHLTRYIMLKDSPLISTKAISLTRTSIQSDGIRSRHLVTPWAKEGSMQGFPWPLRIRRWRIDVFGENRSINMMREGENVALKNPVVTPIIPEWVDLKLSLSEHEVTVDLDLQRDKIFEDRSDWKMLSEEEKRLNQELDALAKQDTGGEVKRKKESEINEELAKVKAKLHPIKEKVKLYNKIVDNYGSELSLIIALVMNNETVIDLARIGSFPTTNPQK